MKTLKAIVVLGCLALAVAAQGQSSSSQAWVRQTDLEFGLVYDMPVAGTGISDYMAPLPVDESGAKFELFAKGTAWDTKVYLLDTKIIQAYSPAASMVVTSDDPYVRGDLASGNYVRRTRCDHPISLSITVSGLVSGSTELSETAVYLGVKGINYDPANYSALDQTEYLISEYNLGNGTLDLGPLYHELTAGGLTNACGEQSYTFVRYASDGIPDTIIAQPKVEIWPLATATVENITAGQVFNDRIPPVVFTLKHLYPDSRTYVQIYSGPAALGTAGTVVDSTIRTFGRYYNPTQPGEPTNVPQDLLVSVDDMSNYASTDGIYTVEVLTETPFNGRNAERLLTVTFEVDRVISSRGQLSSSEKPGTLPPPPAPEEEPTP